MLESTEERSERFFLYEENNNNNNNAVSCQVRICQRLAEVTYGGVYQHYY